MNKFYAVANGREIGIYDSWKVTEPLVKGYPGAKYKSFTTLTEAQNYLGSFGHVTSFEKQSSIKQQKQPIPKILNQGIVIYTDGSCVNKVGGIGYVVIRNNNSMPFAGKVPSYPTTNQVAELYAIYSAIAYVLQNYQNEVRDHGISIFTDSQYSIGCLTEWHYNWVKNGWINSKGEPVANKDLIAGILEISKGFNIKYQHVKAHNGDFYNEWADRLSNEGRLI